MSVRAFAAGLRVAGPDGGVTSCDVTGAGPDSRCPAQPSSLVRVTATTTAPVPTFASLFRAIVDNVSRVIHGKDHEIQLAVVCLLAEGHLLIEDVPGVGKTSLAKALATSLECTWKRVQFTPDLLPTDLVGVSIYQRSTETFDFRPGPLFANIVLADEINRASPKTQSALLEAMEERQVSVEGRTHPLSPPFMVIATQNPVEQEGTYRLPESQIDRFLLRLSLGYPGRDAELSILDAPGGATGALETLRPVITTWLARRVTVPPVATTSALMRCTRSRRACFISA